MHPESGADRCMQHGTCTERTASVTERLLRAAPVSFQTNSLYNKGRTDAASARLLVLARHRTCLPWPIAAARLPTCGVFCCGTVSNSAARWKDRRLGWRWDGCLAFSRCAGWRSRVGLLMFLRDETGSTFYRSTLPCSTACFEATRLIHCPVPTLLSCYTASCR